MSKIYNNIKFLCKQNGILLSDIEMPKKAGFISRYERREAILELPLWIFIKVSATCGVSIDDIVNSNIKADAELAKVRAEMESLKERERILLEERTAE